MARCRAVKYVGLQHGIKTDAVQRDAMVGQHVAVILDVMPDLVAARIFQQRAQACQYRIPI
jgi:hypothetical protein